MRLAVIVAPVVGVAGVVAIAIYFANREWLRRRMTKTKQTTPSVRRRILLRTRIPVAWSSSADVFALLWASSSSSSSWLPSLALPSPSSINDNFYINSTSSSSVLIETVFFFLMKIDIFHRLYLSLSLSSSALMFFHHSPVLLQCYISYYLTL